MSKKVHWLSLMMIIISAGAGCATDGLDPAGDDGARDGVAVQMLGAPGNPFRYVSARDEQLACFGIAARPNFPSNCNDITDFNDKQMCAAMSSNSQGPCTSMTDRNLQLACFALSVAPQFPSNCTDITDSETRNFCFGAGSFGQMPNCSLVNNNDTRALCVAMASRSSSSCFTISDTNDRLFCQGVVDRTQSPCTLIQ